MTGERFRRLWLFALVALLMNMALAMVWFMVGIGYASVLATKDPQLAQAMIAFQQYQNDNESLSEPDFERVADAMRPICAPVNWYVVALVTSVLVFSAAGYLWGLFTGDLRWLGAFPLVSLVVSQNPAIMPTVMENRGLLNTHLSFGQQLIVFTVQMVVVYLAGLLGAWLKRRRQERRATYLRSLE